MNTFADKSWEVYDLQEIDSFKEIEMSNSLFDGKRLILSEISGKDSIAASIIAAKNCDFDILIPSIVLTGTEYGDWNSINFNIKVLKNVIDQNHGKDIYNPIIIYDLKLWNLLNARYTSKIVDKFGFYTPCIGCHLYVHILRVLIAEKLGITNIISGERISHGGKQKINQLEYVLDTYKKLLEKFDINLYMPLKYYNSNNEIQNIVGQGWSNSPSQLGCVLAGNYCDVNDNIDIKDSLIERYCDLFIYPVGEELLVNILSGKSKNYNEIICNVLQTL